MKQFELVQARRPKRSAFDLSHERKTTMEMGMLVPIMCEEVLPGDRFKINLETFLRTLPLVSPVMHRCNLYAYAFFVPHRLTLETERWENFITAENDNDTLPHFDAHCFDNGSVHPADVNDLLDHLGYGIAINNVNPDNVQMSQMAVRAYHKIWNDYFRDQNFQAEFDIVGLPDSLSKTDAVLSELCSLRHVAWEKDYFTAALPTQQLGNNVTFPIGGYAPVRGTAVRTPNSPIILKDANGLGDLATGNLQVTEPPGAMQDRYGANATVTQGLEADLTGATGVSIAAFRRAMGLQRFYEAALRFGRRYVEQLRGIWDVISRDARLQRAEFIKGGRIPVQIGEVLQTSGSNITGQSTPQGNMAGRGVAAGSVLNFDRTFDEHGYCMILVTVLPRTSYATLARRHNFKLDKFDFAFPQLAHLSEQPVFIGEIWNHMETGVVSGREPFGYQPMYEEYRYIPDSVHGKFKTSLNFWGLQREFANKPGLNENFVVSDVSDRIFPVAEEPELLLQSFVKFTAIRPLPKFGTPL